MNKEKKQLLDKTFHTFMNVGLGQNNLELLSDIVSNDVVGIGTAVDEKIFGLKELHDLLKRQNEQSAGMDLSWEINTLDIHISLDENTAIYTNEVTFDITIGADTIGMYIRFSVVLEYVQNKWVVVHWHGSKPELVESEKDTWGIETWKQKAEALEKEVAERTADLVEKNRELQIEAALEKIRSRSLVMHTTKELSEVVTVIVEKLNDLGVILDANGVILCTYFPNSKDVLHWIVSPDFSFGRSYLLPYFDHPIFRDAWESKEKGDPYFSKEYSVEDKNSFFEHAFKYSDYRHFPAEFKQWIFQNDKHILSFAWQKNSAILIPSHTGVVPTNDDIVILKRFATVFEQSYTRFLDLQKAEEQAKEAEIEAGLERVRSAAMAMHQSDDLHFSLTKLFEELDKLELGMIRCGIAILDPSYPRADVWIMAKSGENKTIQLSGDEPLDTNFMLLDAYKAWKKGTDYEYILEGEKLSEYYNSLDQIKFQSDLTSNFSQEIPSQRQHYFNAAFKHGSLFAFFEDQMPESGKSILKRFSKVLNLAYSRFHEIQYAEEQTREAQIQLALERVRARSMAMHKSNELAELSLELVKQIHNLGVDTWFCAFNIYNDDPKGSLEWGSNGQGTFPEYRTPREGIFLRYYQAGQEGKSLLINEIGAKECLVHYDYLCSLPGVGEQLLKMKDAGIPFPKSQIDHVAFFKYGYILFITFEPAPEAHDIFKRFARVFEQTYTRFLDLQKAEEQAKEAQIEAALERVRSRSLAMHHTNELQSVIHSVHQELLKLNLSISGGSFIAINSDIDTELRCWGSGGTADTTEEIHIPHYEKPFCTNIINQIKKGPGFFTEEYTQKEKKDFFTFLFKHEPWSKLDAKQKKETLSGPGGYTRSCYVSKHTSIFIINHFGEKFSEADNEILQRFGKVFEQAYTRFLDLQKAEKQAREAQIEVAVERVRAQSMAMHHPDDLDKVNKEILSQLNWLQIQGLTGVTFYLIDENGWVKAYDFSSPGNLGDQSSYTLQFDSNRYEMLGFPFKTLLQTDLEYFVADYPFEKLEKAVYEFEEIDPAIAKMVREALSNGILTHQWTACCRISNGLLGIDLVSPPGENTKAIVLKMAGAFNQAYTRFLDLKKAEAQTREAKIEAALEKVRSRTMAMQSSSELGNVAAELFAQMNQLVTNLWTCGFVLCEKDRAEDEWWLSMDGDFTRGFFLPNVGDYAHATLYEGWLQDEGLRAVQLDGETLQQHYDWLMEIPVSRAIFEEMDAAGLARPDWQKLHAAYFSKGYLVLITREPCGEEEIFKRFAQVFDQTYTRFLDLQKAEAQTREAQVNLAVERVRARALAMFKSEEILQVVHKLKDEIMGLDIPNVAAATIHLKEQDGMCRVWDLTSLEIEDDGLHLPLDIRFRLEDTHPNFFMRKIWENNADYFVVIQEESDFKHTLQWLRDNDQSKQANEAEEFFRSTQLKKAYHPTVPLKNGRMNLDLLDTPDPEIESILKKMAGAFDLAYKRFEDLQKAETQSKEAQIEAALERVRSRTMAMHQSDELADAAAILFEQLIALGIAPNRLYIIIFNDETGDLEAWGTEEDGKKISQRFKANIDQTPVFHEMFEVWKEQKTSLIIDLKGKKLSAYIRFLSEQLDIPVSTGYTQRRRVQTIAYFSKGLIGMASPEPQPDETIRLLERFAKVFEQTYTRFLDLQQAEAQARESEIQLALERVRARSMAMHKSDELADLSLELVKQVQTLGIDTWFCAFNIYDDHPEGSIEWGSNGQGTFPQYRTPREGIFLYYYEAGQRGETLLINEIGEDECPAHYEYLCSLPGVGDQLLKMKNEGIPFPASQIDHAAFFKYGYILFITFEIVPEAHDIFKRFAKVFQQTYTRFLDLQKSEEQAKEAQVEAALERVRAQAMAMHHTEDLGKTIEVYFEQLDTLIDSTIVRCGAGLLNKENRNAEMSTASRSADGEIYSVNGVIDMRGHPLLDSTYEHWLKQKEHSYVLRGNEIREYYKYITNQVAVPKNAGIDELHFYFPMFTEGSFYVVTERELPEDELNIFRRFSSVLSLTYRRFNDLKKAEAQAREAQIETSLERVRSRTMAMQHSDELIETSELMFEQIKNLDIELWSCGFSLWYDDDSYFMGYNTGPDGKMGDPLKIPLTEDVFFTTIRDGKRRGDDFLVFESDGESLAQTYSYMDTLPVVGEFMRAIVNAGAELPKYQVTHCGFFSHGHLMFITEKPNPEAIDIFKRFTKVFDQTYTRFLDLQKAEEQAREAKIETALEKIRSRTMAMQKGEELQDVAVLLYKELIALGVTNFVTCGYVEVNEDIRRQHTWITAPGGDTMGLFHLPLTGDDTFDARYDAWKKQQTVFHQSVAGQVRSDHLEYAITTFNSKEAEEMVRSQFPDPTVFYCFNFPHGYLHTVGGSRLDKDEELLLARFTKVFAQTYTRFLDLQKAEEQAREAKIEAALEKVRSRTMGMQSSDELPEVANMLFLEVQALGIPAWSCGYCILTEDRRSSICIMSSEGTIQKPFLLPHTGEESFMEWDDFVQSDQTFFTQELGGDAIESHYNYMKSLPQLTTVFKDLEEAGLTLPTYQINHLCKFAHGFLLFITYEKVPESHDIFRRFTNVFDQTYTRFLDLKKAEAQAREAQIENALEKVRSRSLAMQQPDELTEVAQLLREEMGALGVEELETSSIYIHDESTGLTECWFTIKNTDDPGKAVTDQMTIDLQDTWVGRQMHEFYRSPTKRISIVMQGENRVEWIRYCEEKSSLFGTSEFYGETIPERTYHLYKFSNGFLGAASPGNISEESWDLLKRATVVFSFAYTRFSDLQIAEASARATIRQASLDRVRADISSMRNADDLDRITPLFFHELTTLGIPFIRCGVFIVHEKEENVEVYLSTPEGKSLAAMNLPFDANEMTARSVEAWEKEQVYIQHWDQADFINWSKSLQKQGHVKDLKTYQGTAAAPESLHLHFVPFTQGLLYVGSTENLDKEQIDLVKALARSFAIAYARYEDFVKLEQAKAEVESAMSELKATQSQLVQQEKLASLGQLTAGIAHEIKNPLNFVNNFSEVSIEMIVEAIEEMEKREARDETLIRDNLEDIKSNLQKVHEHGSRANGIVTSMLQHSRGGNGKMEPTVLNPIIKEYVNLAFHGMRAGKDPINVDIDLQLDENVCEVPLIAEDFSRVILNLCNNAFDALRQKTFQGLEVYHPKLTVRSKSENGTIRIEIEDNGSGIPDDIKDKILQPFFTTKKGTQGTGLGLSITHDILKAHGGSLEITSIPSEKTILKITLVK